MPVNFGFQGVPATGEIDAGVVGGYCTRADIEAVFGPTNVQTWADLENQNNAGHVLQRLTDAMWWAWSEINSLMRGSMYQIPFIIRDLTGSSSSSSNGILDISNVPSEIRVIAATLAGTWLYESRGVMEEDPITGLPQHRLRHQKKQALDRLKALKVGSFRIEAVKIEGSVLHPINHKFDF